MHISYKLYKLNIREIYEMFHFWVILFIWHICTHIWPYINIILTYMCTYMCTYMFTHMRTYMSTYMFRHICSLSKIYGHYMSLAYMLHICLFRMGHHRDGRPDGRIWSKAIGEPTFGCVFRKNSAVAWTAFSNHCANKVNVSVFQWGSAYV